MKFLKKFKGEIPMKHAKKIFLFVLALGLLVCLFAFGSLAASTATVTYPDGSTQTVTVGEAFKPNASFDEFGIFYGQNETAYKVNDAAVGWTFSYTIDKTTYSLGADLIVPEEAAGKTITAAGATRVKFTVTVGETVTGYTTDSNFSNYIAALDYYAKIKMYADITTSTNGFACRNSTDKTASGVYVMTGCQYYLDINGYALNLTNSSRALSVTAESLYIYSSRPGGKLNALNATTLVYTNNQDYKPSGGSTIQSFGQAIIGEESTTSNYGDNLTVTCKSISGQLFGTGVQLWGGTYVQTGTSASFFGLNNKSVTIKNSKFVFTNASTVPVGTSHSFATFTNCTFVYTGEGCIAITDHTSAKTFTNCKFVNITPSYTAAHQYTGALWGTSNNYPTVDLNTADNVAVYLAHGDTSTQITVLGETYTLDGTR